MIDPKKVISSGLIPHILYLILRGLLCTTSTERSTRSFNGIVLSSVLLILSVFELSFSLTRSCCWLYISFQKSIRSYALSNKAFPGRGSIKNFASCFFWLSIQGCFTGGIWFPCRWLSCSKCRINKNFVLKLLLKFGKLLTLTSFCVKSMFFYSFCTRAYQNGLIERKKCTWSSL